MSDNEHEHTDYEDSQDEQTYADRYKTESTMPPDPFGPVYVVGVVDVRLIALAACVGYAIGAVIFGRAHD